jgi:hypothetical protein
MFTQETRKWVLIVDHGRNFNEKCGPMRQEPFKVLYEQFASSKVDILLELLIAPDLFLQKPPQYACFDYLYCQATLGSLPINLILILSVKFRKHFNHSQVKGHGVCALIRVKFREAEQVGVWQPTRAGKR